MADWTDLPFEILVLIAQRITVMEDFASFSVASKDCWLITALLKNKASLPPRYPRIMLAENTDTKDQDASIRGFLNLLTRKIYGVELPEASGRRCFGALYGWLFTLGIDLQINLLHPFSRQQISLPPMLTLPSQYEYDEEFTPQMIFDMFVRKIAISTSPLKGSDLNDDCVIVAIYGEVGILGFTRLRDTVWTNIEVPSRSYDDVIFHKGKFYAVDCNRVVVICDIDDNNGPKATVVAHPPPSSNLAQIQSYLVESSGDLLLVSRVRGGRNFDREDDESRYYTISFSISRLDESREESNKYSYELTEVITLGDRALFLGSNVSTSMASSDHIKANCIYFTDDNHELYYFEPGGGGRDTGIFNMEDGTIQLNYAGDSRSNLTTPLWYI